MAVIDSQSVITAALSEALEKMAFLMVMPFDEQPQVPDSTISAQIEYTGPISGRIRIIAGTEFAASLAENMGALDELSADQKADAVKELVNVTCGLVLPMIAGSPSDVFDLTVPHLTQSDNNNCWCEFVKEEGVVLVNVEGYPVAVQMVVASD